MLGGSRETPVLRSVNDHDTKENATRAVRPSTAMKPTLLIVDDDEEIRSQMRWGLAAD